MGNCFGRTQIPSIELSEVFKRIRCLCTCCDGRVLIYKSELDGKQKGQNSEQKLFQPQIPSIELSEVLKRIRCLCTCCDGRVLIYKSELDGKQKGQNSEQKLFQPQTRSWFW